MDPTAEEARAMATAAHVFDWLEVDTEVSAAADMSLAVTLAALTACETDTQAARTPTVADTSLATRAPTAETGAVLLPS